MNSLELIQGACRKWLTVPDQTSMDVSAVQDLLNALTAVQGVIWRKLPSHYRVQACSMPFYGPAEGTVTVAGYGTRGLTSVSFPTVTDVQAYRGEPMTIDGAPLTFNGLSVLENPRFGCSIQVTGDPQVNRFNGSALLYPYLGETVGAVAATLYHDATLSPVNIERVNSPVVDRITGQRFHAIHAHEFTLGQETRRLYTMRKRIHAGHERTVFELTPQTTDVVSLAFEAFVSPVSLTLGSSVRPVDLPYGPETGALIIAAVGAELRQHPLFDKERTLNDTADAYASAMRQVEGFSPTANADGIFVGTPRGW